MARTYKDNKYVVRVVFNKSARHQNRNVKASVRKAYVGSNDDVSVNTALRIRYYN